MRIAAIADIHGNALALDAVLADIRRRGADVVVNLGDMLSGAVLPRETADRLMTLDALAIRGNHDRYLIDFNPAKAGPSDRLAHGQLETKHFDWLRAIPATAWLTDDVFLCHGTPADDETYLLEEARPGAVGLASGSDIERQVANCGASLILCGHSHVPRAVSVSGNRLIVNPGSVGMPAYESDSPVPHRVETGSRHARYALMCAGGVVRRFRLCRLRLGDGGPYRSGERSRRLGPHPRDRSLRRGRALRDA